MGPLRRLVTQSTTTPATAASATAAASASRLLLPLLPRALTAWLLACAAATATATTISPSSRNTAPSPLIVAAAASLRGCKGAAACDARSPPPPSAAAVRRRQHRWSTPAFVLPPSPPLCGQHSSSSRSRIVKYRTTSRALVLGGQGGGSILSYATSSSSSSEGAGGGVELTRHFGSAEGMEALGSALWEAGIGPGHTVLLYGDLGTGKTTLARGLIKAACGGGGEEVQVTSPSYLLDNSYEAFDPEAEQRFTVHHMDLYRIAEGKQDLRILGFPQVLQECLCLIEWPQRLGAFTPATRIEIHLTATGPEARTVHIKALGDGWAREIVERLETDGLV